MISVLLRFFSWPRVLVEQRLDLAELLAQAIVLAQRVLVVVGGLGEKRADLAAIVAAHRRLELRCRRSRGVTFIG